ncbi:2'-5' RNA ligase family protein [Furfurilactobacillus siliginis]|uniref:2'-5' RNA ligase n=1 Tax=Furfurilactobacillus siliginis TaxID=348151 RepID=A0A0R2LFD1_9LACO|nr:2'-5' RNA ligase family protein [Furfurilactobacillus siliginis]KRN97277.1 2-5 RNA ligase [Furfurilactobacillus siliginis]GEK28588.1 2'-5' RNA ligase [Furfurilactobacillus siliginis]
MQRSILIFPKISDDSDIQRVRNEYDPLAAHIRPHISLVFPFESSATDADIKAAIMMATNGYKPFEIQTTKLGGDDQGYLWLALTQGVNELRKLHETLYQNPLFTSFLRADIPYEPHITVAHVNSERQKQVRQQLTAMQLKLTAVIDQISVEHILLNGDSEEVIKVPLRS